MKLTCLELLSYLLNYHLSVLYCVLGFCSTTKAVTLVARGMRKALVDKSWLSKCELLLFLPHVVHVTLFVTQRFAQYDAIKPACFVYH